MVLIYNIMPSVFNITEGMLFFNFYFHIPSNKKCCKTIIWLSASSMGWAIKLLIVSSS